MDKYETNHQVLAEKLFNNMGGTLNILNENQIQELYINLCLRIKEEDGDLETFISKNKIESKGMIHYLQLKKTLDLYSKSTAVENILTHLLSQSRNFTQIDNSILTKFLNKYKGKLLATNRSFRRTNSDSQLTQRDKSPTPIAHAKRQSVVEEEGKDDEYRIKLALQQLHGPDADD